jgi:hypothetical protein
VSFKDIKKDRGKDKAGYRKIRFCGEQALKDGLQFFWVDTCCIKQDSSQEVGEAINSMFRWYHNAVTCYVYLSDVVIGDSGHANRDFKSTWLQAFLSSRCLNRGWTLQELLAPTSIEFFSSDGQRLGDKILLLREIHAITKITTGALQGRSLSQFTVDDRISWAHNRKTKREEDSAYSLLGIFEIHMPMIYGEGRNNALRRLQRDIKQASQDGPHHPLTNSAYFEDTRWKQPSSSAGSLPYVVTGTDSVPAALAPNSSQLSGPDAVSKARPSHESF